MKRIIISVTLILAVTAVKAQNKIDQSLVGFRFQKNDAENSSSKRYSAIGDLKWSFKTGGKVFSSPLVANGIVLVGSGDKKLYAVDAKTGKEKWKFTTDGAVHSSPALYGNTVFVGSMDGHFYAIDFATGKQKWKLQTGGEQPLGDTSYWGMKPAGMYMEDLWDCFISSPITDGATVYFGSSDGNLYAADAESGLVKWKFKTGGSIHASPTLHNGTIYIGGWDAYFYAIDAKTGKEKWKFKTGGQVAMTGIQASATVDGGVVYFGARDAHLYALNATSGNLLWKYDAKGSWIISSAVIKEGVLYVGTSDSYLLLAIDAKTGKEKFRFKTNGYVFGTPAVGGGTAYFGDFTGKLYALDLTSSGKRWNSFSTEARYKQAAQVLKKDTLDFGYAAKGTDLSFYEANRKVMDDFYSLGSIVSSPAVSDGVIYFGSADGNVYALNLK